LASALDVSARCSAHPSILGLLGIYEDTQLGTLYVALEDCSSKTMKQSLLDLRYIMVYL